MKQESRTYLGGLNLPSHDPLSLPTSGLRFDDGRAYRIEIPTVEGPRALAAVIEEANARGVSVDRVSQGSGIMLQTDEEVQEMVRLGRDHGIEVCLFVGPRAAWDTGIQAAMPAGSVVSGSLRGTDQVAFALEDIIRACALGLRSVLVADLGLLSVIGRLKASGELPSDLIVKTSIFLPAANPASARVLEELGASTINLPVDLAIAQVAAIRQAVSVPVDMYIEGADDFGAPLRYYEVPELVRVAAPIHLKFTVRNAQGIYPSGMHLEAHAIATARERVRRASIGISMLKRFAPDLLSH